MQSPHHILNPSDFIALARQGKDAWNSWRAENSAIQVTFSRIDFRQPDLIDLDFSDFDFGDGAIFSQTHLRPEMNFSNCRFGERADFLAAHFGDRVDFSSA